MYNKPGFIKILIISRKQIKMPVETSNQFEESENL